MKHLVKKIIYRHASSTGDWYDFGMVAGSGTLTAETSSDQNGAVVKYSLEAVIPRRQWTGDCSIDVGLTLIVSLEDGLQARIGTRERPARLSLTDSDNIRLQVSWEDIP